MEPDKINEKILEYYVKHNCTWMEIEDLIKIINLILKQNLIPCSKYKFLNCFNRKIATTYHLICKNCNKYGFKFKLGDFQRVDLPCSQCGYGNDMKKPKVAFVTFSIQDLLKNLLEVHKDELILHGSSVNQFPMSDIFQGKLYNNVVESHGPCLALGMNSDGVKRFRATKDSLWPLFICLYNLPREIRLKEENILTVGLFSGRDINMVDFVEEFVTELEKINNSGGIMTAYGRIPTFCITASLDSVARPKLQEHTQFNGRYGCSFCLNKGKSIRGRKNKVIKYPTRYV